MSNTNEKKAIDILSILEAAEATPKEARTVRVSSAQKTTIFKSSLYKRGVRTETSLIDDAICAAVKNLHAAGKGEVSYYALTKLFEALNPSHTLKSTTRIVDHVQAKDEIFEQFFELKPNKIIFKDSIIIALNLETDKAEKADESDESEKVKKPEVKLRKKA